MDTEKKPLKEWMIEKGFTQRSLSRKTQELGFKVSDTLINLIVTGKRNNVRADTMRGIAQALGIEMRQVEEFDEMIDVQLGKDLPVETVINHTGRVSTAGAVTLAVAS